MFFVLDLTQFPLRSKALPPSWTSSENRTTAVTRAGLASSTSRISNYAHAFEYIFFTQKKSGNRKATSTGVGRMSLNMKKTGPNFTTKTTKVESGPFDCQRCQCVHSSEDKLVCLSDPDPGGGKAMLCLGP